MNEHIIAIGILSLISFAVLHKYMPFFPITVISGFTTTELYLENKLCHWYLKYSLYFALSGIEMQSLRHELKYTVEKISQRLLLDPLAQYLRWIVLLRIGVGTLTGRCILTHPN